MSDVSGNMAAGAENTLFKNKKVHTTAPAFVPLLQRYSPTVYYFYCLFILANTHQLAPHPTRLSNASFLLQP